MFEEPEYNEEVKSLIERYEDMVHSDRQVYFDLDELEALIEHYVTERKFDDASAVVRFGTGMFPDSTMLMMREAMLLANGGQRNRALSKLKNMLSFEPNNPELHMTLASVYNQNREYNGALRHLKEALKFADSEHKTDIKREMALTYQELDKDDKAVELFKSILQDDPESESDIHDLDHSFVRMGKADEALVYFSEFLDEHPYSFAAWFALGNAHVAKENFEEAVNAYDFCLTICEDFVTAKFNLAHVLIKLSYYKEATDHLLGILEIEKEFPDPLIYCLIGQCLEQREEYLQAFDFYQKALEMEPDHVDALIGIAVIYQELDLPEKALMYAEKAIRHADYDIELRYIKADILRELSRYDEAFDIFDGLPETEKENPVYWLDLSHIMMECEQAPKAIDLMEDGLLALPGNPLLETRKAIYLIRNGYPKEGSNRLALIFDIHPLMISEALEYDEDLENIKLLKPYFKSLL